MSNVCRIASFYIVICLAIFIPLSLRAQILPAEGSSLNYRVIGFSFPVQQNLPDNTLEIAIGNFNDEENFTKYIINKQHTHSNKIIAEVPEFGAAYTWRVVQGTGKNKLQKSVLHHFTTGTIPDSYLQLRVTQSNPAYKNDFIFLDGSKVLFDMDGNPVWYMPPINGKNLPVRDIKLTSRGTVTFLGGTDAYEIDFAGNVLWRTPEQGDISNEKREIYHHEFTRLHNGNYMVLSSEEVDWNQPILRKVSDAGSNTEAGNAVTNNYPVLNKMTFGTVIEYDRKGNVAWSWSSSDYFINSDLKYFIPPEGSNAIDVHENAFFFDEKNKILYVSFKNISRILKIKYPEKTILDTYGEIYKPGVPMQGSGLFCDQHCLLILQDGNLCLFNNNVCNPGMGPMIEKFQEPLVANENLKKIWEFNCTVDTGEKATFLQGGNVIELVDKSLLVCMGGNHGKTFIVNKNKKVLWNAYPERRNTQLNTWEPVGQYRVSIIEGRKDLEKLIWNTEINSHSSAASPRYIHHSKSVTKKHDKDKNLLML